MRPQEPRLLIEDHAVVGDTQTMALIARDGSVDWLCLPRFDSAACFAALLGDERNGRWQICPRGSPRAWSPGRPAATARARWSSRPSGRPRPEWSASIDAMPIRDGHADLVRRVEGVSGEVEMALRYTVRFGYGRDVPWVRHVKDDAGPRRPARRRRTGRADPARRRDPGAAGQGPPRALHRPRRRERRLLAVLVPLARADARRWPTSLRASPGPRPSGRSGRAAAPTTAATADAVQRSLLTLKALTFGPTGGIAAAPTTSLPESIGGTRNWDYRFCWLRDATLVLLALLSAGYGDEAEAWTQLAAAGRRRLAQAAADRLRPRRRAAAARAGARLAARLRGQPAGPDRQRRQHAVPARRVRRDHVRPARGPGGRHPRRRRRRLAAAARDPRAARGRDGRAGLGPVGGAQRAAALHPLAGHGLGGLRPRRPGRRGVRPRGRRRRAGAGCATRCTRRSARRAGASSRQSFVQAYGSEQLDAAVLVMPAVGFLPADDPRMLSTIEAINADLRFGCLVARYDTEEVERRPASRARAPSSPAPSGWSARSPWPAGSTRRPSSSRSCSRCATTSGCWPRSTTGPGCSATSRRPSATWRSSTPRPPSPRCSRQLTDMMRNRHTRGATRGGA